ncbi:hypothetical protein M413DRAFT_215772 [Hebeloma cylindrosporum]|uniref:Uncharacterized protein n=1 Tax=Hebeloma cylindrosporum TaxID=76867 RepID=A0A0C2YDR6_HEBCY|nr:hypothetical protein M413DRAFT_215772 [Hebeloma cylindrosporum h7]
MTVCHQDHFRVVVPLAPFEVPLAKTGASSLNKTKDVRPLGRAIVKVDQRNVRALLLRFWPFYQIPLLQDLLNAENFLDILHFLRIIED